MWALVLAAVLMPKDAEQALEKMRDQVEQVKKLTGKAKDEKDLVKFNCAREKLEQVQGLVKVGEEAETALRTALDRRELDAAERASTRLSTAAKKVVQLQKDAEQCIGQLTSFSDEKGRLEVESPSGLPASDPTAISLPPGVVYRPPPASGF
jgi:hypothetical protein